MQPVAWDAGTIEPHTGLYVLDPQPDGQPPVLLLHALGADAASWGYQMATLLELGMRPVAPDLPGFGHTPVTPRVRWSIAWLAAQVDRLLGRLALPPAVVVGLSMGGTVALQLALDFPQRVQRLVIANSFAALRPQHPGQWAYLLGRLVRANLRGWDAQAHMVAWRIFPAPDQEALRAMLVEKILASDQRTYRKAMRALALFDVRHRLGEIRVPTLVISGAEDTTVPLANQAVIARGIRGARQVIIPNAGHGVSVDQPETFNRALLEFISSS